MMSVVRGVGLILTKEGGLREFGTAKGEGVKNPKNLADIICTWPLRERRGEGTFHARHITQYNQSLYSHKGRRRHQSSSSSIMIDFCSFCTISTSESEEIERTYIVTPTSTAGPVNDTLVWGHQRGSREGFVQQINKWSKWRRKEGSETERLLCGLIIVTSGLE